MTPRWIVSRLLLSLVLVACDQGSAPANAPKGSPPDTIAIAGGDVTEGFAFGVLRTIRHVDAFKIATEPVTAADFAKCQAAGACGAPKQDCLGADAGTEPFASPRSPALCVGDDEAKKYCEWTGGRLPTLLEWLDAARGPSIARFPWGDLPPTCDQHPLGGTPIKPCTPPSVLEVGGHAAGASKSGMRDVLLAPGELVATDADSIFAACATRYPACVVTGTSPGAIETVEAVRRAPVSTKYAFHCAYPK